MKQQRHTASLCLTLLLSSPLVVDAFLTPTKTVSNTAAITKNNQILSPSRPSSSALNVWWFGGTESKETFEDEDSCELVAVRIERTSANSRGIAGDITVDAPLEDVWAILTDYNRLSTHVPNLVESKITSSQSSGSQGDGQYTCRLYQKGAQKIIGFEFGADVTMDMTEQIVSSSTPEERKINFKCVDSFFFSGFDGEWKATEIKSDGGDPQTMLSYTVDVRPKGPVPVAALEWRIREDVPTNLRAVKRAAQEVGAAGVQASKQRRSFGNGRRPNLRYVARPQLAAEGPSMNWLEDETMAAYLKND